MQLRHSEGFRMIQPDHAETFNISKKKTFTKLEKMQREQSAICIQTMLLLLGWPPELTVTADL